VFHKQGGIAVERIGDYYNPIVFALATRSVLVY